MIVKREAASPSEKLMKLKKKKKLNLSWIEIKELKKKKS